MAKLVDYQDVKDCIDLAIKRGYTLEEFRGSVELWDDFVDGYRWISVDERLPDEHDSLFAKYAGTEKWRPSMWLKSSDTVEVTIEHPGGQRTTTRTGTHDGIWFIPFMTRDAVVVAWRPLSKPYEGRRRS